MRSDFDTPLDRSGTNSIKWMRAGEDRLAMGLADMDFRTAPAVLAALSSRVEHGVFGYTEPGSGFFDAVTGWSAERRAWPIDPAWVTPSPGVMTSIAHVLRAVVEPGAGVIVQTPSFPPIPAVIEDNGYQVVESPLLLGDGRYEFDVAGFESAARRPHVRAFVLCSPHNPVGRVWARDELAEIADIAADNDIVVISDEIHCEVVFPWATFVPYAAVAGPDALHVTLFGPSKGFNLPGLRTSVSVIPDSALRTAYRLELRRVNEDYGINVMGAVALEAAYSFGGAWLDSLSLHLQSNLAALSQGFAERLPAVSVIRPDASFLVWIDCRELGRSDAELLRAIQEGARISVEPGVHFGTGGSGFFRLNIATQRNRVEEAVERLGATLAG